MQTLHLTLADADEAVLVATADAWGVGIPSPFDSQQLVAQLSEHMLQPANAEAMWDLLNDNERQALQTLLGSSGKMPMPMFKRLFGDIRRMGSGVVLEEQPHKQPQSAAEALIYRGLVAEGFAMTDAGPQAFAYVPEDLAQLLPTHKTAYDDLVMPEADPLAALDSSGLEPRRADTSIVDDMTTLLAFLQLYGAPLTSDSLAPDSVRALQPYLLVRLEARIAFMLTVGISAGIIEAQEGRAYPRRADTRRWLSAPRTEQIRMLVDAWAKNTYYGELWHIPGLKVEQLDGYDPTAARKMMFQALAELVPPGEWWDVDEFLHKVKLKFPDFQRPNGDYDNWYIRDMADEYVRGFESWDTVEGALIEYIITGPMHWLGLMDIAPDAARLTAYGRASANIAPFPRQPDDAEQVSVQPDGRLLISRKVPRIDRFQVARFTTWSDAPAPHSGEPFVYYISREGLQQADEQGINTGHITTFLNRVLDGAPIPDRIERTIHLFQHGGEVGTVSLERVVVLRTTSEQVLDDILNTPELRRYLGARLGAMACAVRADQWAALREALAAQGITVTGMDTPEG